MKSALGLIAISFTFVFSATNSRALKMTPEDARKDSAVTCSVQEDEDLMISEVNLIPIELMENEIEPSQESFSFMESSPMGIRIVTPDGVTSDVCEKVADNSSDHHYRCPIGEKGLEINGYVEFIIGAKDPSGNETSRVHLHVKNYERVLLHLVSPMTCTKGN